MKSKHASTRARIREHKPMPRRRATVDQASIARAVRAAKQAGASAVEVQQPDGTLIRIVINAPALTLEHQAPDHNIVL